MALVTVWDAERCDVWKARRQANWDKDRYFIILSPDRYNRNPRNVKVAGITVTKRNGKRRRDDEVDSDPPEGGLQQPSRTRMHDLQWIERKDLLWYSGPVSEETMMRIEACVQARLGILTSNSV